MRALRHLTLLETESPWRGSSLQTVPPLGCLPPWMRRPSRAACLCLLMRDEGRSCEMGGYGYSTKPTVFPRLPGGAGPTPRPGQGLQELPCPPPCTLVLSLQSVFLVPLKLSLLPLTFPPSHPPTGLRLEGGDGKGTLTMTLLSQGKGEKARWPPPAPHVYVCSLKHFKLCGVFFSFFFFFDLSVPVTYSPTTASN